MKSTLYSGNASHYTVWKRNGNAPLPFKRVSSSPRLFCFPFLFPSLIFFNHHPKPISKFQFRLIATNRRDAMIRSCFRPLERCLGRFNGNGVEGLWHKELKPHALGDYSIAVVQANSSLEDQGEVLTTPSVTFVGVYDGHGGPEASRFVKEKLFPYINKFSREQGGLSSDAIKKAFDSTEEDFLHLVRTSFPSRPKIASVGSCCLVGAITNDVLYVANLGDSRAVLGRRASEKTKSSVVAERLTTDHNVSVEEVRKEVRDLHPDDSHIVICNRGVWRIKGIIQVSRSIGDAYLKKPEFHRNPMFQQFARPMDLKRAAVTADPSIIKRKINADDLFLVFASDGLWEQLSDETVVEIIFKSPRAGIARRLVRSAIREAARKKEMDYDELAKMEKGTRRYFHDDMTVVVVYLDHQQASRKADKHREDNRISAPAEIFSIKAANGNRQKLHRS